MNNNELHDLLVDCIAEDMSDRFNDHILKELYDSATPSETIRRKQALQEFEESRKHIFDKYPALHDSWKQYLLTEQLYTGEK